MREIRFRDCEDTPLTFYKVERVSESDRKERTCVYVEMVSLCVQDRKDKRGLEHGAP